jgi:hypothetical protein
VLARVRKTAGGVLLVTAPAGRWAASDAEAAIKVLETLVVPGETYAFAGDASVMTGYEPGVRRFFQEWVKKRSGQLSELWIVGADVHPFVRLGVAAAAAFVGRRFRFVKRLADVPGAVDPL